MLKNVKKFINGTYIIAFIQMIITLISAFYFFKVPIKNIDFKNHKIEADFNDNISYRGDIKSGIQGASDCDLESDVDADNITARVKKLKMIIKH